MNKKFIGAMTTNDTVTENLMPTHSTTNNSVVDLFFKMAASRQKSEAEILQWFKESFAEDRLLTVKAGFYNRDIRGGQGERRSFRIFYKWLCEFYPETAEKNLVLIPEYGRWDDLLFIVEDTPLESQGFSIFFKALEEGNKLAGKWGPREGKKFDSLAKKLTKFAGISPQVYRQLLVKNTKVVENLMCKNLWEKINFSTVPSVAQHKYRKAFFRHEHDRYEEFLKKVISGDTSVKIHADAIFPHDIVHPILETILGYGKYKFHRDEILNFQAQWMNLPDYFEETGENILPICDVSGSMTGQPMEVSVALGMYCAERNKGAFQNLICTFSENPHFFLIKGENIVEKISGIARMNWGMSTNLEAVFELILEKAVNNHLTNDELPHRILILSDMQFNQCVREPKFNALTMMKEQYSRYGYKFPQVIFWNLRTSSGVPVKFDERGTCLVSGFSPSILKNILSGELDPIKVVLKTLNDKRYSPVKI